MSVILLGATITIAHFSLSLSLYGYRSHILVFLVSNRVYPLLTRLFGGPRCLGSSLGTWAFTSSNPLLTSSNYSRAIPVLGTQITFLRMPLNDPCLSPTWRIVKSIQGLWIWLTAPQFPPSTDTQNNSEENESSRALVAEVMTLGFLDSFSSRSMERYPTAACLGQQHYRKISEALGREDMHTYPFSHALYTPSQKDAFDMTQYCSPCPISADFSQTPFESLLLLSMISG